MKSWTFCGLIVFVIFACQTKRERIQSESPPTTIAFCGPKNIDLDTEPGHDGHLVPLFEGLDLIHYPVSTTSKIAQQYFDQGLILSYGFNHAEAARSFQEAIRLDPECAMCHWGLGFVLGPNYNTGMEPEILPRALEAISNARLLLNRCTPKEKALIKALAKRYPDSQEKEPAPYYQAFADAMRDLHQQFPDDQDIAAITAEALMDLHPWDLWLKDGTPQPWTPEIVDMLEHILQKKPNHPQANHLYIHALEASPNPEKALTSADILLNLVPGSGHLVHMPSHLYINTGRYHKGTLANEMAVKTDSLYLEKCHASGVYPLAYYPHNWHFLAACAALEGRGERAIEASRFMAEYVDKDLMRENAFGTLQHYYSIPWYIQVKFAKWDDILTDTKPDADLKYPLAIWHYARGMAFCGKGDLIQAEKELDMVKVLEQDEHIRSITVWEINNVHELVRIAIHVLQGEIAFKRMDYLRAVKHLKLAIAVEDQLNYNEPPDWFFSVRHLLGNVLIESGQFPEAEQVYRNDLKKLKENGWALIGLYHALEKQGKQTEASQVQARFKEAWKWAEIQINASAL